MQLHLSTSQCVFHETQATVTDDQPFPDPLHPAADAFHDEYSWWNSTVPVNLAYMTKMDSIMPAQMRISIPSHSTSVAKEIHIFGSMVFHKKSDL